MYTGVTPSRLPDKIPSALESSPHPCFALTESLEISYCNAAWDRFALENGGGQDVLASRVLHKPFLQFVPRDLAGHFMNLFRTARALGRLQSQDYECSTPELFRVYRMQIYPLQPGCGFVVINSLRVVHPHTRVVCEPDETKYRDKDGLIHMCANCRRACRAEEPAAWDWVPAYVQAPRRDLTHGVCPFCREYYYGDYLPPSQRAG
jgi:hypothetical protein